VIDNHETATGSSDEFYTVVIISNSVDASLKQEGVKPFWRLVAGMPQIRSGVLMKKE